MKLISLCLCTAFCLVHSTLLCAQSHPEVVKAFESGFESKEDFETVFKFVQPRENEIRWREVDWLPGLWEGIQTANETKKPMFIWAMNGDPLGCV
jgi:hypothetical protein